MFICLVLKANFWSWTNNPFSDDGSVDFIEGNSIMEFWIFLYQNNDEMISLLQEIKDDANPLKKLIKTWKNTKLEKWNTRRSREELNSLSLRQIFPTKVPTVNWQSLPEMQWSLLVMVAFMLQETVRWMKFCMKNEQTLMQNFCKNLIFNVCYDYM